MRGRPKAFDRDAVLEKALELFWEKGYAATGIGELTAHMGIGRQSLYDTFGDKQALYLEALALYKEKRLAQAREIFEAPGSPMGNLRAFFVVWREEALCGTGGCMMVNTSTELGPVDDAAARIVERAMGRLETLTRDLLERARDAGELTPRASPRALARLIMTLANGMAAQSRLGLGEEEIDDVLGAIGALITSQEAIEMDDAAEVA